MKLLKSRGSESENWKKEKGLEEKLSWENQARVIQDMLLVHQILELQLHQNWVLLMQQQQQQHQHQNQNHHLRLQSMSLDSVGQKTMESQKQQSLIGGLVTGQMIAPDQVIDGVLMIDHLLLVVAQGPAGHHPDVNLYQALA